MLTRNIHFFCNDQQWITRLFANIHDKSTIPVVQAMSGCKEKHWWSADHLPFISKWGPVLRLLWHFNSLSFDHFSYGWVWSTTHSSSDYSCTLSTTIHIPQHQNLKAQPPSHQTNMVPSYTLPLQKRECKSLSSQHPWGTQRKDVLWVRNWDVKIIKAIIYLAKDNLTHLSERDSSLVRREREHSRT